MTQNELIAINKKVSVIMELCNNDDLEEAVEQTKILVTYLDIKRLERMNNNQ